MESLLAGMATQEKGSSQIAGGRMTEITIQQAATFVVALTFGVVASVVGEIVRRNAARKNGKQSIYDEWERRQKETRGRK